MLYTVGGTATSILLGLIAALALRQPFRGRAFVRGAFLLPWVAPVVAVTFVWDDSAQPGVRTRQRLGSALPGLGQAIPFLSQSSTALFTVIAFEAWRYFPFAFLFITARLQALPAESRRPAASTGRHLSSVSGTSSCRS